MQTIETTGKSLQEATVNAARELGATPDDITVTVLEEHKGLFGKATVRIRAERKSEPEPAKTRSSEKKSLKTRPEPEPEPEAEPVGAAIIATEAAVEAESEEEVAETPEGEARPEATEQDGERLHSLLQGILDAGNLEVTSKVTGVSGRYVNIELDGKDVAFLVGKHGEVLNALQYVLNIIANQRGGNGIRATLDGNNYRHRREEALTKLATKIAEQVQERGEEAVLDALPAFERRIVHKALADYEGVTTYSEGEEPNRRVVIAPAD